jgi:hypothetical protein
MYGACGGTIYKVEFFLNNFNNFIKIIEDSFDEVQKLHQIQFGYLDMFMPVLYMLCNSTYDDNVFLCETHRNSNCMNSNSKIIHGKQIYN